MKFDHTNFDNIFYICNDEGVIIGIRENPGKYQRDYYVGDTVEVTDDGCGYICPGITTPGVGKIHRDDNDHFFTVKMENGEIGLSVKSARLKVVTHTHTHAS